MSGISDGMRFALDYPLLTSQPIRRLECFRGWYLDEAGMPANEFEVSLDGKPLYLLPKEFRYDLPAVFPQFPRAAEAGFSGDVVIPDIYTEENTVTLELAALLRNGKREVLVQHRFSIGESAQKIFTRPRSYSLADLIEDPETGESGAALASRMQYPLDRRRRIVAGVPHFHDSDILPIIRLTWDGETHPYGSRALQLIDSLPVGAIFLDLGSGIKSPAEIRENGVCLDTVHFPTVDIVNSCGNLPFKSHSFDLVISQAVFEHLPDPFHMAAEILRILKPNGLVLIDTAFMQPQHADPNHYFNMTIDGLKQVLKHFEIVDVGIQPYQLPSYGLRMQLETILPHLADGVWKARFLSLLADLKASGNDLDRDLGPIGQQIIAAGVFAIARRPIS